MANFLLNGKHYLAALELHQDLLENLGESVDELVKFFSNSNDFIEDLCKIEDVQLQV